MADGEKYIVRGAKMQCKLGSHKRKINLPVSHGSYVNNKPVMNAGDKVEVKNITWFGICRGSCPSSGTINLVGENGGVVTGKKCTPKILGEWVNTKENTKVEGKAALTTKSKVYCMYGGEISFVTDGQQEE